MEKAINAYYTITASPEFRERERLFEKARHDEAQALYHERLKEKSEIAKKMLAVGEPIDRIRLFTDLTQQEIENLRTT